MALGRTIGVVVVLGVAGAIVYAMIPEATPVDAATVAVGPMQVTVDDEGQTRIRDRYIVSSPLVGRLRRIKLDPGDAVEADTTVLAVIEPTDPALLDVRALAEAEARVRAAEAAIRRAESTVESARAAYDYAENELGRITEAADRGAANDFELDHARMEHRQAIEEFRAAQFGLEIAEYELEVSRSALLYAQGGGDEDRSARMLIHSPIDGAVLRVFQESVAVVSPGDPLLEVGDPRDLEMVIDVLSVDGVKIRPGQRVIVEHWGGPEPLEGVVRLVEPSAFTKISALGIEEQRVNVIADFASTPDERGLLGDAFRVEARIVIWESGDALAIPTSAAFRDAEAWAVFVVEGGRARLRHIEPGRQNGRLTQVLDGLAEGERVVLHPSDRLRDGARVRVRAGSD